MDSEFQTGSSRPAPPRVAGRGLRGRFGGGHRVPDVQRELAVDGDAL